jgi:hypothetical protein
VTSALLRHEETLGIDATSILFNSKESALLIIAATALQIRQARL